jgi:putative phosphoribosyl transferase
MLPFPDRRYAGRLLGAWLADELGIVAGRGDPGHGVWGIPWERERPPGLAEHHDPERVVVLALPRGGVPVASEIAACLDAPMDVLVTRKIGYPPAPELGVGAIAEGGEPVYDTELLRRLGLRTVDLTAVVERERAELARRVRVYRGGRPPLDVAGRCAIVADDGLATGVTARAALRALRARRADRTVLAVPVGPPSTAEAMRAEADEVVILATPEEFNSVGEWYTSFTQLSDSDVLAILAARPSGPG